MYRENAPFHKPFESLRYSDLVNHGYRYEQIALEKIPTAQRIAYIKAAELKGIVKGTAREKNNVCTQVFAEKMPVCIEPDQIVLPISLADRDDVATLLSGIDQVIVERSSSEWLTETTFLIEREFLKSKNQLMDHLTALYNETACNEFLSRIVLERGYHIVLAASLAPARSASQACTHIMKTGRLLEDFNRYSFPLFHLGNSIFAFIIFDRDREFLKSFCHAITSFFRTNGQKRLHIGFSGFTSERHGSRSAQRNGQVIMDEAWSALQKASRRGPYSFCDFELFVNPAIFPIRQVTNSTRGKLSYRMKESDTFSLVVVKPDAKSGEQYEPIFARHLNGHDYLVDGDAYIIIRNGISGQATKKWLDSLKEKIVREQGETVLFSAGIASFPFHDYKKGDVVHNSAKALYHASFYGPGSVVVFDSLSLNVSGDACFGEGDMAMAVREYQRGLELSPGDVNLLNSLGVAYGLMGRTPLALATFEQVLAHHPENFMAWYNKGLSELSTGNDADAIYSFINALEHADARDADEAAVREDIIYQLGMCQFRQQNYREAVILLKKWYRARGDERIRMRCARYLGISYYHLQDYGNSSTWLQRALTVNESDAEALSLLAEIYMITGEGDDIARKFSEKSIEIEPDNPRLKLRYGRVLSLCGHHNLAFEIISQCCRSALVRCEAWLEAADHAYRVGEVKKGDFFAGKVLNGKNSSKEQIMQARLLSEEHGKQDKDKP